MKKLLLALLVPFAMLFSFPSFALTSGADSIDYAVGAYVIETETHLIHRSEANLVTENCMLRYAKCAADALPMSGKRNYSCLRSGRIAVSPMST